MKIRIPLLLLLSATIIINSCKIQKNAIPNSTIVYQTDHLIITQLSNHAYAHTSFFNSETFGKVPCNGLIVLDHGEAIVFDTPADDSGSVELINWIQQHLKSKINAVIPTHFHVDCVGGLQEFYKNGVPAYATFKTIELAKQSNFNVPNNGFERALTLKVGTKKVWATFFGEGHTKDNIVGYFPSENILFGGCLVKELNAGKGNLEDANVAAWAETVEKVKQAYPKAKIVIPGHGKTGGKDLLDYTIQLFERK